MTRTKAVVFDFIGTLINLVDYSIEKAEDKLFLCLANSGYDIKKEVFLRTYKQTYEKYRRIRYEKKVEVTNAVWVSEALSQVGFATAPKDDRIKTAVNVYFEDYIRALRLRPYAALTLRTLSQKHKLGLISNFTHAPVIYRGLRKLKISDFFNVVMVSEALGWRKPHPRIFKEALKALKIEANEAVFVGDSPVEDIQGAQDVGMRTVFVQSQFNSLDNMEAAAQRPSRMIEELNELLEPPGK